MTGNHLLDWALIAVSLFNMILLLWLGLTVLLNVERQTLGSWILGCGLLLGAAFFVSHTAILSQIVAFSWPGADFWWQVGWLPVLATPFAWYGMILWYTGFWASNGAAIRRRHRPGLIVTLVLGGALTILILFGHALPSLGQLVQLDLSAGSVIGGLPLLFALYPLFIVLCVSLSIDALRHPAPSERMMGDLARHRTRPWLMAAAVTLLLVSLLVTWFMAWVAGSAQPRGIFSLPPGLMQAAPWFDLLIGTLIGAAVLLIGQAIVSYEVFTGRSLPRRGFQRHWQDAIVLAAGYAAAVGGGFAFDLQPTYSLLLTTILMVAFYALFSWRSFVYRERFMAQLRPFVGSQGLTRNLTGQDTRAHGRAEAIFHALCADVLSVERAMLLPMGRLAALVGASLHYPPLSETRPVTLPANLFSSPDPAIVRLEPSPAGGYQWAIPLWAERGLIGALLLGARRDGGFYVQEEIEIARATGERIIDMLAGEEMTHRLMALQQRQLAKTRVLDHWTRRALHDEVLPDLHRAVLLLSGLKLDTPVLEEVVSLLADIHRRISNLIHIHPALSSSRMEEGHLLETLQTLTQSEFAGEFATISWEGDAFPRLDRLSEEVIFYAVREAIRNAALHGRGDEPGRRLNLDVTISQDEHLTICVRDDGVGLSAEQAMANDQGGLALHSTMVAIIGGHLTVTPAPGGGTQTIITV